MNTENIILETLGMMGFTFLVGMSVAYVILVMVDVSHFMRPGHVSDVVQEYKTKLENERKRRKRIRKVLATIGKDSDDELLKYMYENTRKYNDKEEVDELNSLFNFYKGMNKREEKENDGINELIKYYNGEV